MARAEDLQESNSDGENSEWQSGDSDGTDSSYDSNSDSGGSDGDIEGGRGDEEQDEEDSAVAKKQRVRGDIDELRRMMVNMDTIKARLEHRLSAERRARAERLKREDREREEQEAVRRKADEEARGRQVEVAVQTELIVSQQQMNVSQHNVCPPHLGQSAAIGTVGETLPAANKGTGFADAAPNKAMPAGLSLYDLVKAPGFGLSLNAPSSVRREDSREEQGHVSLLRRQQQLNVNQQNSSAELNWSGGDSRFIHDEDSVVGVNEHDGGDSVCDGYGSSWQDDKLNSPRSIPGRSKGEQSLPPSHHYDENSASVSNSLVSSDTGSRPAVSPDLIQQRDSKFNAAALLSTSKHPTPSIVNNNEGDKTDEQREMEAIQFLLFRR